MSSKPSFIRKQVRKFRSLDFSNDHPFSSNRNSPASSEPIAGGADLVVGAMEPTHSALMELTSLAKTIPYISPAAGLILQALKMCDEVKQCKEEWKTVMEKLTKVGSVVVNVGNMCRNHGLKVEELPSDLLAIFGSFQSDLDGIDDALRECADVKGIKMLLLRNDLLKRVKQYDSKLSMILQVYQANMNFFVLLTQLTQEIEVIIRGLPYAGGWSFGDEKRCLEDTRQDFLDHISKWVENPESERTLVVLGQAGTGKSSIAHEVARRFEKTCLGSYFAFRRGEGSKDKAYQLFTTLACDLSDHNPAFKLALGKIIKEKSSLRNTRDYRTLFEWLLLEPLKNLKFDDPILIVIDALDESGYSIEKRGLHTLLAQRLSELPSNFRILITSRPQNSIEPAFVDALSVRTLSINDPELAKTEQDIAVYLRSELPLAVFEDHGFKLTKAAEGVFQWAAVACGFIHSSARLGLSKTQCVQRLLGHARGQTGQGPLDNLYEEVLKEYFESPEAQGIFRSVMGQLLAAAQPLSIESLMTLRHYASKDDPDDPELVLGILSYLGSLLSNVTSSDRTQPIVPLHTSFYDFLTNKKSGAFYVELDDAHHQLAHSCLGLMLDKLKFNICELESSYLANSDVPDIESRISKHVPPALSYSCIFWNKHLEHLAFEYDLFTKLRFLFEDKFLFWLEVLSVKNSVGLALPALSYLVLWLQREGSQTGLKNLLELVNDASTFVRYFGMPVAKSAPHIYVSALPFAPSSSRVSKQYFHRFSRTLTFERGQMSHWPALEMSINAHDDEVTSVAFSPDGQRIVSASRDRTIRVWDAATGQVAAGPFTGHTSLVNSVAFSPDGQCIASASSDGTIRVWDVATGQAVADPFTGHTDWVNSVAFSPDGERIASASDDRTIRVWDVATGQVVAGPFTEHTSLVKSVAFSPDGLRIASASYDCTIRVWDVPTGQVVAGPFTGHTEWVSSVSFSTDGQRIASASYDRTIRMWDAATGRVVAGPFTGHTSWVHSIAFSPDGQRIVSASADRTICVWDAATGQVTAGPFTGHTSWVYSVAFSPDGQRIASASRDHTIRVWDAATTQVVPGPFTAHTFSVYSVAFSPDGQRIASASRDRTIRVWDAATGQVIAGPFTGPVSSVKSVAFSPDGRRIASASRDCKICVWDAATGQVVAGPFAGHTESVNSVAFSPDGQCIASASRDCTIRVWDAATGQVVAGPFTGPTSSVKSIAFSPDGQRIASASRDRTIRVWDAATGQVVAGPFTGHTSSVNSVSFSPDGLRIASASDDHTIRVWDAATGQVIAGPFTGHTSLVNSVAFSPDGQRIASASSDRTIRVWDAVTGRVTAGPFTGHTSLVNYVAFSPDGQRVASASDDRTIRMWDAATSQVKAHTESVRSGALQDGVHFTDQSFINDNGWIYGPGGEKKLFLWIPELHRRCLYRPSTVWISGEHETRLDLSNCVHGSNWATIYHDVHNFS